MFAVIPPADQTYAAEPAFSSASGGLLGIAVPAARLDVVNQVAAQQVGPLARVQHVQPVAAELRESADVLERSGLVRKSLSAVSVTQMKHWLTKELGTTLTSKRVTAYQEFASATHG